MAEKSIMRKFHTFPTLKTERLCLRGACLSDVEDLYLCRKNKNVCRYEYWLPDRSEIDTLGFVIHLMNKIDDRACTDWLIQRTCDEKVIGLIALHHIHEENRSAEMGFWLGEEYWHCGYASEAAKRLIAFAFRELKLNKLICMCSDENTASEKTIRSLGMTQEGILRQHACIKGVFHNLKVFSLLKEEFDRFSD